MFTCFEMASSSKSCVKSRPLRSPVWDYFEISGLKKVHCKLCVPPAATTLAYGGTTSMQSHLYTYCSLLLYWPIIRYSIVKEATIRIAKTTIRFNTNCYTPGIITAIVSKRIHGSVHTLTCVDSTPVCVSKSTVSYGVHALRKCWTWNLSHQGCMLKSDFESSHLDNRLSNLCISSRVRDLLSEFCDIDWIIGTLQYWQRAHPANSDSLWLLLLWYSTVS